MAKHNVYSYRFFKNEGGKRILVQCSHQESEAEWQTTSNLPVGIGLALVTAHDHIYGITWGEQLNADTAFGETRRAFDYAGFSDYAVIEIINTGIKPDQVDVY